ncbi:MAG: ferritin family protein, partial [Promethearchaeota archaeon]
KKTTNNLILVYIEKIQAAIRYEIFSDISREEGYLLSSKFLFEIANKEKEYAKWIYNILQKIKTKKQQIEKIRIEVEIFTFFGITIENLENSIIQKEHNWKAKFPNFVEIAKNEGFSNIAKKLREIANSEKQHFYHLKMLLRVIKNKSLIKTNELIVWKCIHCGFEIAMEALPNDWVCPSCGHLKPYFISILYKLDNKDKLFNAKELTTWICMECGYEIEIKELPDDWKCPECKHPQPYFKRKPKAYEIETTSIDTREMAVWICSECGYEAKISLPKNWKCPCCGN